MGPDAPQQPHPAPPAGQQEPSAREGDDDHQSADIVIKAGGIHSMAEPREADAQRYQAMAVRDGRIVALAPEREGADALIGDGTVLVDDPGLTVLPTCDDTHTHLLGAGAVVNDVQVGDARNLGEFLGLIARRAATTPPREWIVTASNWHELQLAEKRMPTRQELDSAAPDNPVLVKRGGHNDMVNSEALRLAGVTAGTQAPEGGVIEHDATGQPTGRFEDSAIALVEQLLPTADFGQQVEGLRLASAAYAATGIGAVRDAATRPGDVALLRTARDRDALAVRTQMMVIVGFEGPKPVMTEFLDQLAADGTRPGELATLTMRAARSATIGGVAVVTNTQGFTLYSFAPDTATTSKCNGVCAQIWPPVTGPAIVGQGVTGRLGTITRFDGSKQATYDGHPLYTYTADAAPGQASGNGINVNGGVWHEVTASGAAAPASRSGSSGGGGYGY